MKDCEIGTDLAVVITLQNTGLYRKIVVELMSGEHKCKNCVNDKNNQC